MFPKSTETSIKRVMDLEDKLEKTKMDVQKLRKEKKQMQRQIDDLVHKEAKLNTKLSWQRIQNKRDEREREIRNRKRMRYLQQTIREDTENAKSLPRDLIDPELSETLEMVYNLEENIILQLEAINVDTIETKNSKKYLDSSFETICLLIEQARQQKEAIKALYKKREEQKNNQLLMEELNMSNNYDHNHTKTSESNPSHVSNSQLLEEMERQITDYDDLIRTLEELNHEKDHEIERLEKLYALQIEDIATQHQLDIERVKQESHLHVIEMKHTHGNNQRDFANTIKLLNQTISLKSEEIRNMFSLQATYKEQISAMKAQSDHWQFQLQQMRKKVERRERYIRAQELKRRTNSTVCCSCWRK